MGINVTYQDSQTRMDEAGEDESVALPGTFTDAKNMHDYLSSQGFSVTWMRDNECKHSDTACSSCKNKKNKFGVKTFPNAKNIRNAMRGMAKASKPNDVLWFFFAGHGSQQKDRDGDEEDGKDEIIMPADYDLE